MFTGIKDLLLGTKVRAIVTGAAVFALVSALDFYTRNEISLDVFYFLPIFIFTWWAGWRWGTAAALGGIVDWLVDERLFAASYPGSLKILLWNTAVRLAFFLTVAALIHIIKRLLAKERSGSKLKSALIHTVSHEFNNALTGLSAGLFLLKETDGAAGDETRSKIYSSMDAAQHKLSLYVKNILNEARVEEGKFKVEKQPLALRDLANDIVESVGETLRQKGIKLKLEMPERPVLVRADREVLSLVISNLLGNAVKYTRQAGEITIKIEAPGREADSVVFSVEDSGIGISLEDLKKITSGFYRTEDGQAQAEGFGMGLKISNELLELHGSRLEISSEKGKGSCFFFELPQLRSESPQAKQGVPAR
jgi:signal transduction histidine kinase